MSGERVKCFQGHVGCVVVSQVHLLGVAVKVLDQVVHVLGTRGSCSEVVLIADGHRRECDALIVVDFHVHGDWSGQIVQDTLHKLPAEKCYSKQNYAGPNESENTKCEEEIRVLRALRLWYPVTTCNIFHFPAAYSGHGCYRTYSAKEKGVGLHGHSSTLSVRWVW